MAQRRGTHPPPTPQEPVPAGVFSHWLDGFLKALEGDGRQDVPCGECIGCCSSSYFIHIGKDDHAARKAIPADRRFAAPGMPKGHELMGYDDHGLCPMLESSRCSIYEARPTTCRQYDCRLFAAAGIDAGGAEKRVINDRVKAWAFEYPTEHDRALHQAVREAATFLRERRDAFPGGRVPENPSQVALIAVRSHAVFLDGAAQGQDPSKLAERIMAAARGKD